MTDTNTINNPGKPNDPGALDWPEGGADLPEQMGGTRTTLMPAIYTFGIPASISQLWKDVEIEDTRPYLASGQPNPTKGQKIRRRQLKFTRDAPLVVQGGPHDGEPMTATFSTNPRPRGKKDDPKTPWISDAAYLLDVGLKDRSRPTSVTALEAAINKYAGKTVRLETGLTAQCRPDKVRYIPVTTAEGDSSIPDPTGTKGCGKRYYTPDFKNDQNGAGGAPSFDREIVCACKPEDPMDPGAVLRGFESVERILPPLGQ